MPVSSGPNTVNDSIVFTYDIGDVANSYKGEPTTNNYGYNFRDFTGTGYSPDGEWTANPTQFTKTYYSNYPTPIGPGATLIKESGGNGYHHLSRYGGGSESGAHSLSCYLYPLTTGITDFCIGLLGDGGNMIFFNLDNKTFSYGGGISNGNAIIENVPGWPGWLRVGANFEGRVGGWVGSIGYSQYTSYTGTTGGKPCYITGMQYEYKPHPTPFTDGTRSSTQGLLDISGNSNTIDLACSYDNNAQPYFDATDDYFSLGSDVTFKSTSGWTVESVVYYNSVAGSYNNTTSPANFIGSEAISYNSWYWSVLDSKLALWNISPGYWRYGSTTLQANKWYHIVLVCYNGGYSYRFYLNGAAEGGDHVNQSWNPDYSGLKIRYIGKGNNANPRLVSGKIPITKVYNRELSSTEIQNNYLAYKTRFNLS